MDYETYCRLKARMDARQKPKFTGVDVVRIEFFRREESVRRQA